MAQTLKDLYPNLRAAGLVDAYGNPYNFRNNDFDYFNNNNDFDYFLDDYEYVVDPYDFDDFDIPNVGATGAAGASASAASGAASAATGAAEAAGAAGASAPGLLKRWGNKLSPAGNKLKGVVDPDNYHWTKGSGINFGGKLDDAGKLTGGHNLGGWLTLGHSVLDATQIGKNLIDASSARDNRDSLVRDIAASAGSNPMAEDFLTGDEIQLLNRIRNGTYRGEDNVGKGLASGIGSALAQGGLGVLTGAAGGIPGMVLGGIGGVAKGLSSGVKSQTATDTSKLQSLYSSLRNADAQYKSMRRPSMNGLNMQSRYREMYS